MIRRSLPIALALAAAACTREAPVVAFGSICSPPDGANACSFASKCASQYLGEQHLDVTQTDRLWLVIELHNQAKDTADPGSGRANGQDAYLQEIRAEYAGALALPATAVRVTQVVPAAGTAVVSVILFEGAGLVPGSVPAGATGLVIAKVRGKGVFGDGSSFETPILEVPVKVCNNCIGAPPACATAGQVLFTCPPNWGQTPVSTSCAAP